MSYSEDAVNAKLSALNETQESIVTTAEWVMFHRYSPPQAIDSYRKLRDFANSENWGTTDDMLNELSTSGIANYQLLFHRRG